MSPKCNTLARSTGIVLSLALSLSPSLVTRTQHTLLPLLFLSSPLLSNWHSPTLLFRPLARLSAKIVRSLCTLFSSVSGLIRVIQSGALHSVGDLGRQGRFPTLALASTTERAGAHAAEFQLLLSALTSSFCSPPPLIFHSLLQQSVKLSHISTTRVLSPNVLLPPHLHHGFCRPTARPTCRGCEQGASQGSGVQGEPARPEWPRTRYADHISAVDDQSAAKSSCLGQRQGQERLGNSSTRDYRT